MKICPPEVKTIAEAKKWLIESAVTLTPCKCPVCGQSAKLYPRKLSANLVRFLKTLYKKTAHLPDEERWVNISRDMIVKSTHPIPRDYSILRFWGFLTDAKGWPGYWRITEEGVAFIEGRIKAPEKIYLYNNHCVRASDKGIGVDEAVVPFHLKAMLTEGEIE